MSAGGTSVRALADPARAHGADDPGAGELTACGYITQEWLLHGDGAGAPFTTRVLIRRPQAPERFSGVAVLEPMHLEGSRPVWSTIHPHLTRAGHMWMEVACQRPAAEQVLIEADPERYGEVELLAGDPSRSPVAAGADPRADSETFVAWWWWSSPQLSAIIGSAVAALRRGELGVEGVETIIFTGISQAGGIVRRLARAAADGELGERETPDGLLAANSGGSEPMASAVTAIELLAEADLESVRAGAGLPGQARGLLHRQPDSASFRLYEVAGMSHADSRRLPSTRTPPPGSRWSRFPHWEVFAAALELLIAWVRHGTEPPPGAVLETERDSATLLRDELGHPLGGWRTLASDLPRARLQPLGDGGRAFPFGCEIPLTGAEFTARYGSEREWLAQADVRAAELVAGRWLLAEDARQLTTGAAR